MRNPLRRPERAGEDDAAAASRTISGSSAADDPAAGASSSGPNSPERHRRFQEVRREVERSAKRTYTRARFMIGGGYRLLASANFGELVLGYIEAKFCK